MQERPSPKPIPPPKLTRMSEQDRAGDSDWSNDCLGRYSGRMADKFEQVGKALAKGAVQMVPGGAVVLELVTAILPNNDENLRNAIWEDLQEGFAKVQEEVNRLKARVGKLEELGALRTLKLQREFASAYADASGEAKRQALINIAAKQFDPTWLDLDMRSYWFGIVRNLSDHQIVVLQLLYDRGPISITRSGEMAYSGGQREGDSDRAAAYSDIIRKLKAETTLVGTPNGYALTPQGRSLVRAMRVPDKPSP